MHDGVKVTVRAMGALLVWAAALGCSEEVKTALVDAAPMAFDGGADGTVDAPPEAGASAPRVETGRIPRFHMQAGKARNDVSGVAFLPALGKILVVDDGGDSPPDVMPFQLADLTDLTKVTELRAPVVDLHGDLEGATFDGTYVYVTSSLSPAHEKGYEDQRFRALSRFRIENGAIVDAKTIDPSPQILVALQAGNHAEWYDRVKGLTSRMGGLNVEGIAAMPGGKQLLVGLRSPHGGDTFPMNLRSGEAFLVKIDVSTFTPETLAPEVYAKLDLGGLGVRSIEYSPTAGGYFIFAGHVEAGWDYGFYFWRGPGATPVRVTLPEFDNLCRPEAITEVVDGGRKRLLLISEDSGAICEEERARFNYVLVDLDAAFLGTLK